MAESHPLHPVIIPALSMVMGASSGALSAAYFAGQYRAELSEARTAIVDIRTDMREMRTDIKDILKRENRQ